jgi:5'-3' exonuclease
MPVGTITVALSHDTLLVDTSYMVFHRYYSLCSWFKRRGMPTESLAIETVLEQFQSQFVRGVHTLVRQVGVPWCNVCFVRDCPRDAIWRRAIFPEYKKSRPHTNDENLSRVFGYTYDTVLPELVASHNVGILHHPRAEADDLAAIVKKRLRELGYVAALTIVTNDNDLIQLADENTIVRNLQNHNLTDRVDRCPKDYLKLKILLGDKSDSIGSIYKGCGQRTAMKLAGNEGLFEQHMQNEETRRTFERNSVLIDLDRIPADIVEDVLPTVAVASSPPSPVPDHEQTQFELHAAGVCMIQD